MTPRRHLALALLLAVSLALPALAADTPGPVSELRELLERRLAIMADVARSKWTTGAAVEDPPREAALLAAGAEAASTQKVAAGEVDTLLRAQIEAAKLVQARLFADWRAQAAGPFPGGAELLALRRPEIARITAALVPAYARARPLLLSCASRAELESPPPELPDDAEAWAVAVGGVTAALPACD